MTRFLVFLCHQQAVCIHSSISCGSPLHVSFKMHIVVCQINSMRKIYWNNAFCRLSFYFWHSFEFKRQIYPYNWGLIYIYIYTYIYMNSQYQENDLTRKASKLITNWGFWCWARIVPAEYVNVIDVYTVAPCSWRFISNHGIGDMKLPAPSQWREMIDEASPFCFVCSFHRNAAGNGLRV